MQYRREIDGLRAVAVLPVILFHAGIPGFGGGYVGVDVFFVLSGFLITTIIAHDLDAGRFSLINFYERRARRILPALFFVVLVCVPFAWAWMLPFEMKSFGASMTATALFVSNILFWRESGYFAAANEFKPLLHTWSLAVEEQYYLLFPPVLMLLWGRRALVVPAIIVVFIGSLAIAEWASYTKPSAAFYWFPTRAWELLAGALLALWITKRGLLDGRIAELASGLGLALIIWANVTFDAATLWPGVWALAPVLGTVAVIWGGGATVVGRMLSWRPLVGIGLISYSAYLWHQPVFAFARIRIIDNPSAVVMAGLAVVSLGLAWVSWRFVEQPFRRRDRVGRAAIFGSSFAGIVVISAIGMALVWGNGAPHRVSGNVLAVVDNLERKDHAFGRVPSVIPSEVRIALIGDSHAETFAFNLSERLGAGMLNVTKAACAPVVGSGRAGALLGCGEHNAAVAAVLDGSEVQTVILSARWPLMLEDKRFDNGIGGVEHGMAPVETIGGQIVDKDALAAGLRDTIQGHLDVGRTVVFVGPIPEVGWNVPVRMARGLHFGLEKSVDVPRATIDARVQSTWAAVAGFSDSDRFIVIDPRDLFCDDVTCFAAQDGAPLYRDDDHLSILGAGILSDVVLEALPADR